MPTNPSGPRPLWLTAHAAVENGYDVTIQPRGATVTLFARRGKDEVVARWKRADRHWQGDREGRWRPDGRPSVSSGGVHGWMDLADLPAWFARTSDAEPVRSLEPGTVGDAPDAITKAIDAVRSAGYEVGRRDAHQIRIAVGAAIGVRGPRGDEDATEDAGGRS